MVAAEDPLCGVTQVLADMVSTIIEGGLVLRHYV